MKTLLFLFALLFAFTVNAKKMYTVKNFESGKLPQNNHYGYKKRKVTVQITGGEGVTQGKKALKIIFPGQVANASGKGRSNFYFPINASNIDWLKHRLKIDVLVVGASPMVGIYMLTDSGYRVAYLPKLTGSIELPFTKFNQEGKGTFAWKKVKKIQISFFSSPGLPSGWMVLDNLRFDNVDGPDYGNLYYLEK